MRLLLGLFICLFCFSLAAQTHTNRGGSGPDEDKIGPCPPLLVGSAKSLQNKYLKLHKQYAKVKLKKINADEEFVKLIQSQNLELDMELIQKFKLPDSESCLSEKKEILQDLIKIYERNSHCPEFWKKHELIPIMKNIIVHGK